MSKIFTFILLLGSFFSFGQIVNIPDPGFKIILVSVMVADLDGDGIPDDDVDTNNDGEVQVSEAEAVIGLYVNNMNQNVQSLEGIQSFANLEVLDCLGNDINDLDVTQNTNLIELDAWQNNISSIDVSQNPNLEVFWIGNNPITSIDLSQNPNLLRFYCYESPMASLDLTNNPLLLRLGIGFTEISSIDLSQNSNITGLFSYNTNLTSIDVTNLSDLEQFYIGRNNISSVDLSQNINLIQFRADDAQLTVLDVSQNPLLEEVWVSGNNLNNLNIANGNNINFTRMLANDNPNLLCIEVDDVTYANNRICDLPNNDGWCKDATAVYSEECILGADDYAETNNIKIYPNPVNDVLHIEDIDKQISSLKLFSSEGRLIKEFSVESEINISFLQSGLYFIEVISEGKISVEKFLKL